MALRSALRLAAPLLILPGLALASAEHATSSEAAQIAAQKAALAAATPTILFVAGIMALALTVAAIACALGSHRQDDWLFEPPSRADR